MCRGIRICELLPLLAKQADKYSIIRSMTHGINGHETAAYMVQTGRHARRPRWSIPSVGAVVSLFKGYDAGYKGLIPPYIVLTEPQGRFSEAGFLGARYKPFATGGDPAPDPVRGGRRGRPGHHRQAAAGPPRAAAQAQHAGHAHARRCPIGGLGAVPRKQAYDLILGDAGKVFDLSQEKDDVRDRYGRNTFGQSCLVARRLVERGVPYITINYKRLGHAQAALPDHAPQAAGTGQGPGDAAAGSVRPRPAGQHHRLVERRVRPHARRSSGKPPWNGGRGHYGKVFSRVVAGGGFKGGQVVGASDAKGEEVKDRPVYPVRPDRQHVRTAGHRSRRPSCRIRRA